MLAASSSYLNLLPKRVAQSQCFLIILVRFHTQTNRLLWVLDSRSLASETTGSLENIEDRR